MAALLVYLTGFQGGFHAGHDGWCAARRGVAGRNLLLYGPVEAKFGAIENVGKVEPKRFDYYWHHPSGPQLLVGLSYAVFGAGEWQTRLVPLLVMLAALWVFSRLAFRFWGYGPGFWAALAFFVTIPMLGYYGPWVAQHPIVLLCGLGSTLLYMKWRETGAKRYAAWAAAVAVVAAWSDWAWFLFAFLLAVIEVGGWIVRRKVRWTWILGFSGGVLAGLAGALAHLFVLSGAEDFETLKRLFGARSGGEGETLEGVLDAHGEHWVQLFTPALVAAGAAFLVLVVADLVRRRFAMRHALALAFLVMGATWVLLFKQGARVHEYWSFYATPFFVIAGAEVVSRVTAAVRRMLQARPVRAKRLGAALAATMVVLVSASAMGALIGRHVHPAQDHPEWSDGYFHRYNLAWSWMRENTALQDAIVLDRPTNPPAGIAQLKYYADRDWHTIRVTPKTRKYPKLWNRDVVGALDMRLTERDALQPLVQSMLKQAPCTVVGDVLIMDIRPVRTLIEEKGRLRAVDDSLERPELTYLDVRYDDGVLSRWMSPTVPLYDVVPDRLLGAAFLLDAGYTEDALREYVRWEQDGLPAPDTLRHHVARYNLDVAMGRDPGDPMAWVHRFVPALEDQSGPIPFGKELSVLAVHAEATWRFGTVVEAVVRVDQEPTRRWLPFLHRMLWKLPDPKDEDEDAASEKATSTDSDEAEEPKEEEQRSPRRVVVFPDPSEWKAGRLILVRKFVPLPPWPEITRVAYRFGFWSPGDPKKKTPTAYLRPPEGNHLDVPVDGGGKKSWLLRAFGLYWLP